MAVRGPYQQSPAAGNEIFHVQAHCLKYSQSSSCYICTSKADSESQARAAVLGRAPALWRMRDREDPGAAHEGLKTWGRAHGARSPDPRQGFSRPGRSSIPAPRRPRRRRCARCSVRGSCLLPRQRHAAIFPAASICCGLEQADGAGGGLEIRQPSGMLIRLTMVGVWLQGERKQKAGVFPGRLLPRQVTHGGGVLPASRHTPVMQTPLPLKLHGCSRHAVAVAITEG